MKKALLMGTILVALFTTGCIKKYEYTEQQTDSIAEYAAVLLIESDKDYQSNFTLLGYLEDETSDENSKLSNNSKKDPLEQKQSKENDNLSSTDNSSLKEVLGAMKFDISYKGYKLHNSYPEDGENAYFYLTPGDDEKLMVVTFEVTNVANKSNELKLLGKQINYRLTIGNDEYKALLTLLEEDLQHFSSSFKKGEMRKAFLVFEVPEDMDTSNLELLVTSGQKTEMISLK